MSPWVLLFLRDIVSRFPFEMDLYSIASAGQPTIQAIQWVQFPFQIGFPPDIRILLSRQRFTHFSQKMQASDAAKPLSWTKKVKQVIDWPTVYLVLERNRGFGKRLRFLNQHGQRCHSLFGFFQIAIHSALSGVLDKSK